MLQQFFCYSYLKPITHNYPCCFRRKRCEYSERDYHPSYDILVTVTATHHKTVNYCNSDQVLKICTVVYFMSLSLKPVPDFWLIQGNPKPLEILECTEVLQFIRNVVWHICVSYTCLSKTGTQMEDAMPSS